MENVLISNVYSAKYQCGTCITRLWIWLSHTEVLFRISWSSPLWFSEAMLLSLPLSWLWSSSTGTLACPVSLWPTFSSLLHIPKSKHSSTPPLCCHRALKLKMDAFLLLALFCYILNHPQSSGIALTGRLGQIMALFLCSCCALLLNSLVQLQYHRLITVCIVHWHMFSLTSSWLSFDKSPHLLLCPLSLSLSLTHITIWVCWSFPHLTTWPVAVRLSLSGVW